MPRLIAAVLALVALSAASVAFAQESSFVQGRLGTPCRSGQFGVDGALLTCDATTSKFRYMMPEEVPPTPDGGFVSRPPWYPPIAFAMGPSTFRCPSNGFVTFTSPIIRREHLGTTIPQGLMIYDHVTPIDHGYIGIKPLEKERSQRTDADWVPVFAPADGRVTSISSLGSPTSNRIVIDHGCETYSILMVVNRLSGALGHLQDELMSKGFLNVNVSITAGVEIAQQRDNMLDFSVHDGATWLSGFIAPFSYTSLEQNKLYTVDPWPYFSPDLAEMYLNSMQRVSAPRWGRIDVDIAGTPAGNWFLEGTMGYSGLPVDTFRHAIESVPLGHVPGKDHTAWSHLSVARHWVQPDKWVFSTGWWSNPAGDPKQYLIEVPAGKPGPDHLRAGHGMVVYPLRNWRIPEQRGEFLPINYTVEPTATIGGVAMQVGEDGALNIEVIADAARVSSFTAFTGSRRRYLR